MAVSGPLFRDLTPPNLEYRTKKKGPRYILAIFPTRYRLFDGTHFCLGSFPRFLVFGVQRRARREAERSKQAASTTSISQKSGLRCLWAWQSSDLGDPGALEGTTRTGKGAYSFLYPVRGLTKHRISYRGSWVSDLGREDPGARALRTLGEKGRFWTTFPGFDPSKPGIPS